MSKKPLADLLVEFNGVAYRLTPDATAIVYNGSPSIVWSVTKTSSEGATIQCGSVVAKRKDARQAAVDKFIAAMRDLDESHRFAGEEFESC